MIGTSINQYQITASIGAGGMGEVFRARDTRLNRDVAVKVLPKDFVADADRLRRFEQEAKILAALNHPNILTIHEAGVHDGAPYLVSELLEGRTLREEMNGGALPIRKAREFALQISQGLAAAHVGGIIHRDLKPENIFLTKDGRVKILDFGLAKLRIPNLKSEIVNPKLSADPNAPTVAQSAAIDSTEPGRVMGTPSYMSPEQVRGKAADHRADIFAFGAILYEMLCGQRAFKHDTPVETMNAILTTEPVELADRLPNLSPMLERVVRRCLEKDPARRFQTATDLAFALENAGATSTSLRSVGGRKAQSRFSFQRLLPWAVAAVCLAGILFMVRQRKDSSGFLGGQEAAAAVRKFALYFPSPAKKGAIPDIGDSLISPDGQKLVYQDDDGLWLRWLDRVAPPKLLATTIGWSGAFWSPQSMEVAYFENYKLYRIPIGGGQPSLICLAPEGAGPGAGGVWLPDGRIFFTTLWSGLHQAFANGSLASPSITLGKQESLLRHPSGLPGTNGVIFVVSHKEGFSTLEAWALGGPRKVLLKCTGESIERPVYSPSGHILYSRNDENRGIWAFPFSLARLERIGEPFRVADEGSHPSVAEDGTLLIGLRGPGARQLVWVDRTGQITGTNGLPQRTLGHPRLSPDENQIAFSAGEDRWEIWIYDLRRNNSIPLVRNQAENLDPYWFPEGRKLLFRRWYNGEPRVFAKPIDGIGAEEELFEGFPLQLSRSGNYVLFESSEESGKKLSYAALGGTDRKLATFPEEFQGQDIGGCMLSPSDALLAYRSNETRQEEVYVVAFPSFTGKLMVSHGGGRNPWWHPKGSELFYLTLDGRTLMSVKVKQEGALQFTEPTKVFELPDSISSSEFDVTLDGQRFLMIKTVWAGSEADRLAKPNALLVQNWFEQVREKK